MLTGKQGQGGADNCPRRVVERARAAAGPEPMTRRKPTGLDAER